MEWTDPTVGEPAEESEDDMSSLAAGFATLMSKRAESFQVKTTPDPEVSINKRPKRSGSDEEAHNSIIVITVDSSERASGAFPVFEGATQEAPRATCASLEDGIPDGGPLNADRAVGKAPLEIVTELSFLARLANADPRRLNGPHRLMLKSPIIPMKWEQPLTGTPVPSPDTA